MRNGFVAAHHLIEREKKDSMEWIETGQCLSFLFIPQFIANRLWTFATLYSHYIDPHAIIFNRFGNLTTYLVKSISENCGNVTRINRISQTNLSFHQSYSMDFESQCIQDYLC